MLCLIQSLEGRRVLAELRGDTLVRGKLDMVDDYMNLTLSDATVTPLQGTEARYPFLYVRGRNIRFVHLPKSLNPEELIEMHRKRIVDGKLEELRERLRNQMPRLSKGESAVDENLDIIEPK